MCEMILLFLMGNVEEEWDIVLLRERGSFKWQRINFSKEFCKQEILWIINVVNIKVLSNFFAFIFVKSNMPLHPPKNCIQKFPAIKID